jgi:hypothetical protein
VKQIILLDAGVGMQVLSELVEGLLLSKKIRVPEKEGTMPAFGPGCNTNSSLGLQPALQILDLLAPTIHNPSILSPSLLHPPHTHMYACISFYI